MGILERIDKRLTLMNEMMHTVGAVDGIPAAYSAEQQLRTATTRCIACRMPESCGQWLAEHRDGAPAAPDFCPNRQLFASWAERMPAEA